jgi:ABC-type sugar transport system substrate-binding protein
LRKKEKSMIRFGIIRSVLVVGLLDAVCMFGMNHALKPPAGARSHMLFIGNATGEYWQRSLEGARDAAKAIGAELDVEMPTPSDPVDQQNIIVQKINPANYDGVAMSPADPVAQVRPINDLASQTKLVTIDRDGCKSRRMCHVGFSQASAGQLAARLVRDQLSRPGKVLLLVTTVSNDARNTNMRERLAGFKEQWGPAEQGDAIRGPIVKAVTDADIAATLADPELAFIVAVDFKAAVFAIKTLAAQSEARRVPIIAFEPNDFIFDAIEDGRVSSAIFDDPYRSGFTAIERLETYRGKGDGSLPVPGYGSFFLFSEVVQKDNLAEIRRRTNIAPTKPPLADRQFRALSFDESR